MTYEELELEGGERKPRIGHGVAFVRQPRLFKSATDTVSLIPRMSFAEPIL